MAHESSTATGFGLGTVLFIVFLILKLTHTIDWSWWWVTSPLWIPLVIILLILAGFGLYALFILTSKRKKKWQS